MLVLGCAPSIRLTSDATDPLEEFTLEGNGRTKILVIPIRGFITDQPGIGLLRTRPSMVQEVVAHLKKAAKDPAIRAVVLKINTPGGTATASDILYNELMVYKEKSGAKVVAAMMDLATSGGYYLALGADRIMAHPTTVTGSVGVIFMRPRVTGLMDKIGVGVEVNKSGRNKDMGSPFREATAEEAAILQGVTDGLARRFMGLVAEHRGLSGEAMAQVATARIYLAEEAVAAGLVDRIGYLKDAVNEARKLTGLAEKESRLVVYRRSAYPDDNLYNTTTMATPDRSPALVHLGIEGLLPTLSPGFYYLWPAMTPY
ncbi:MAG: signal peptide peptidase SppA [Desulfobacterales bacterium]|nr:signal peptide peptidase SppA [Desulfobacterales bacterium]